MRRTLAALALLLSVTPLAACGGEGDTARPTDSEAPKVIEVTFDGDSVTPNGERVEISAYQDVELKITADQPGEIHVHSDPEQQLEYPAGDSTETIKGITTPGTVDVESHSLDKVIVQLEVH